MLLVQVSAAFQRAPAWGPSGGPVGVDSRRTNNSSRASPRPNEGEAVPTTPCLRWRPRRRGGFSPPALSTRGRSLWAWAAGQTVTMTACGVLQNVRASVAASRSAILGPALRSGRAERRGGLVEKCTASAGVQGS